VASRASLKMFNYLHEALRRRGPKETIVPDMEPAGATNYLKLAWRCQTQNEFNRLHIELENICTPLELAGIAELAKSSKIPEPSRLWLEKIGKWTPGIFDAPQRFECHSFSAHVTLYQDPERSVRDKGLLVAFAGNARRLMMPVSVFLQFVESRLWDVVVLKKDGRNSYLDGMDSVATDFHGLVEYVKTTFSPVQYRRVITLGTSSGGFAAAWAALLMDADRGVSISGCPPRALPARVEDRRAKRHGVDLCYVYGMESAPDHQSAIALLGLFGGRLRPVPDIDTHGALGRLLKRGQFAEFLDEMLS
jgi:hypothetical protein